MSMDRIGVTFFVLGWWCLLVFVSGVAGSLEEESIRLRARTLVSSLPHAKASFSPFFVVSSSSSSSSSAVVVPGQYWIKTKTGIGAQDLLRIFASIDERIRPIDHLAGDTFLINTMNSKFEERVLKGENELRREGIRFIAPVEVRDKLESDVADMVQPSSMSRVELVLRTEWKYALRERLCMRPSSSEMSEHMIRSLTSLSEEFLLSIDNTRIRTLAVEHSSEAMNLAISHRDDSSFFAQISCSSASRCLVSLPTGQFAENFITLLARSSWTTWVERKARFFVQNDRAAGIIQTGSSMVNYSIPDVYLPLYSMGVTGLNEIVGISDTGIDYDSCYFVDPAHPTPAFDSVSMSSRKIVQYLVIGDREDDDEGHGTHTSGTVAGKCLSTLNPPFDASRFNGIAYNARIAFADIGVTGEDYLSVPEDMEHDLFLPLYQEGTARIFSNSWGSDKPTYDSFAEDIDSFIFDHADALVLFANGNSGDKGLRSVGSPATAKNVIAVGASRASLYTRAGSAQFGPSLLSHPIVDSEFRFADDVDDLACNTIAPAASEMIRNRVAVVRRGTCSFETKAINVQGAGAIAMIVVNQDDNVIGMAGSDSSVRIPSLLVSNSFGNYLKGALSRDPHFHVRMVEGGVELGISAATPGYSIEDLAYFSSLGPTTDGRIKPDICSPGMYIISADSDGNPNSHNCGVIAMQGTSMATPVAAGAAALVRQYLRDGFYPTGSPNPKFSIWPSASLMRSILVHGSRPMNGFFDTKNGRKRLDSFGYPSFYQGFGLLDLATVLPFDSSFHLYLDQTTSIYQYVEYEFDFELSENSKPFKVTLTWMDPPSTPTSSMPLVFPLFFGVRFRSLENPMHTVSLYGNHMVNGNHPDLKNNVQIALFGGPGSHEVGWYRASVYIALSSTSLSTLLNGGSLSVDREQSRVPQGFAKYAVVTTAPSLSLQELHEGGALLFTGDSRLLFNRSLEQDSLLLFTWNLVMPLGGGVQLVLSSNKNSSFEPIIIGTASTSSDSFSWVIPRSVPAGTYFVRIQSRVRSTVFDTTGEFHILKNSDPVITPHIQLISPVGGQHYRIGSVLMIRWATSGTVGPFALIQLFLDGHPEIVIAEHVPVDAGFYRWTIPLSTPFGGGYSIRISALDSTDVFDESGYFVFETASCPSNCSGHGRCNLGVCECDSLFFGDSCSNAMEEISVERSSKQFTRSLSAGQTIFFSIRKSTTLQTSSMDSLMLSSSEMRVSKQRTSLSASDVPSDLMHLQSRISRGNVNVRVLRQSMNGPLIAGIEIRTPDTNGDLYFAPESRTSYVVEVKNIDTYLSVDFTAEVADVVVSASSSTNSPAGSDTCGYICIMSFIVGGIGVMIVLGASAYVIQSRCRSSRQPSLSVGSSSSPRSSSIQVGDVEMVETSGDHVRLRDAMDSEEDDVVHAPLS